MKGEEVGMVRGDRDWGDEGSGLLVTIAPQTFLPGFHDRFIQASTVECVHFPWDTLNSVFS